MKKAFAFTSLITICLLSSAIVAMDKNHDTPRELFAYANNKQWDLFKQSLSSYEGRLDARDEQGYTFLHRAILDSQQDCVEGLIKKGAPLKSSYIHNSFIGSEQKRTIIAPPLHYAVSTGHVPIINILISPDKTVIQSNESEFKNTPLHLAAWFNQAQVIPILISGQADIHAINSLGSAPVHLAAWRNSSACLVELLNHEASATQENSTGKGNTPLYLAAKSGSLECLRILTKHLRKKLWVLGDFLAHINQKCADDNSNSVQVAGTRHNVQCYWDLVVTGGDYKKKLYNKRTQEKEFVSQIIRNNTPLKTFLEAIEGRGKDNPPRYSSSDPKCFLCHNNYEHNDVVMTLGLCTHSCHAHCFQDYSLDCCITKNKNNPQAKDVLEKEPIFETKHRLRTNPIKRIKWNNVDMCPVCKNHTDIDKHGILSVFLAH